MSKILPNQVYAGLYEIVKNKQLYYHSSVGDNYCHLTEEGEKEVVKWIQLMAPQMVRLEQEIIDKRAKEMVWDELKK